MFAHYYRGRRVLVTGHTGFKGGWLSAWLERLGAEVWGLALPPEAGQKVYENLAPGTFKGEYFVDVRDASALRRAIADCQPEFVFHLAAQALVKKSYQDPLETVAVNVMGTLHLLEAVRHEQHGSHVLVVTSDKCYENQCWDHGYRETDPMGGHDPYSMSKGACELAVSSWRRSFFATKPGAGRVVTARAGNVIGGGDFCDDRIVPDCVRSLCANQPVQVRNPHATRPWQHVLDCLSGYLCLGSAMATWPAWNDWSFNFGPSSASNQPVRALVGEILKHWPGTWQDKSDPDAVHEASRLHLSTDKAAATLGWQPTWPFADAIRQTILWYKAQHEGREMKDFTLGQIEAFCKSAAAQNLPWASNS